MTCIEAGFESSVLDHPINLLRLCSLLKCNYNIQNPPAKISRCTSGSPRRMCGQACVAATSQHNADSTEDIIAAVVWLQLGMSNKRQR